MEITARDLRIGNLIFDHECEPHYFEVEQISKYVGSELWIAYRKGSIKTKTAEGIPLTEDWLLKFGCIEQKISSFKSNFWNKDLDFSVDVNYYENGKSKVFQYLVNNQQRKKQILYVHKLQNLHFELKDTELTLTK